MKQEPGSVKQEFDGCGPSMRKTFVLTVASLLFFCIATAMGQTKYSLSASGQDGTVALNPTGGSYVLNTVVTLTPTPNPGFSFNGWSGDTSGAANPLLVTMKKNRSIKANFINHAPTNIILTPSNIAENLPANTVVGTLSATDQDAGGSYSFSLAGGADQNNFGVSSNHLVTTKPFNFETKSSHTIIIRVNDGSVSFQKTITVAVSDVSDYAPPASTPTACAQLTGPAITLSWTPVEGAYNYKLSMGTAVGGTNLYNGTAGTATSVNVTGLPINGSTINVRITTTDVEGPHTYDYTYISYDDRPKVASVAIQGTPQLGATLTGHYTFQDADPEGVSLYKWYRADDATGTNKTAITGATQAAYALVTADENKFMQFEVTPVAQTGTLVGLPAVSAFSAPVTRGGFAFTYPEDCGTANNMKVDGMVVIGDVTNPTEKLEVAGVIKCDELRIKDWAFQQKAPDFIFKADYKLRDLKDVESFIKKNSHLPEVPSAEEMQKNGLNITEFNMVLLKKIEELTLHAIAQEKKIEELEKRVGK